MPRSETRRPSAARPAANADFSIGPETRVSEPRKNSSPGRYRAAALPRARASSGVSSVLAVPRMPSVPNRSDIESLRSGLALRVLRRLASLFQAVLLALFFAGVARQESRSLQSRAELRVDLYKAAGNAEAEGARLTRDAAAVDRRHDVVAVGTTRDPKRLGGVDPVGRRSEVVVEGTTVDGDLPFAG